MFYCIGFKKKYREGFLPYYFVRSLSVVSPYPLRLFYGCSTVFGQWGVGVTAGRLRSCEEIIFCNSDFLCKFAI